MANFSKNVTKLKIAVVAMVLSVVCSAVLIGRLFYLQIIDGDYYKQMALNQQLKDTIIEPHRGSIYDTNMKTMATSKTVYSIARNSIYSTSSNFKTSLVVTVSSPYRPTPSASISPLWLS